MLQWEGDKMFETNAVSLRFSIITQWPCKRNIGSNTGIALKLCGSTLSVFAVYISQVKLGGCSMDRSLVVVYQELMQSPFIISKHQKSCYHVLMAIPKTPKAEGTEKTVFRGGRDFLSQWLALCVRRNRCFSVWSSHGTEWLMMVSVHYWFVYLMWSQSVGSKWLACMFLCFCHFKIWYL